MKKNSNVLVVTSILFVLLTAGCAEKKKEITKLEDAKTAIIGVMTGTTGEQLVKKKFPEAIIKSFDDVMDAVVALKSSQLDAVVTGWPAAMNIQKNNPELPYLENEPVDLENTSIAVNKENKDLLKQLNDFIEELKNDGTLKDMRRRWFKKDTAPYETVDLKPPVKGKILRVGTSATREPFCFVDKNGMVTGHDGELARRIGVRLGRPVQFFDMKFSALIPALKSGKIDLICAGMTATPERSKSVDFTVSYFQNMQVMIVRKALPENIAEEKSFNFQNADDVKDKKIAILIGSVFDTYAVQRYPNATLLQYKSPSEILLAVRSGKADAAIYTHEALIEMLRNDKEMSIFSDTLFTIPIGIGFNQNNDALREKFNKFLKGLRADGTYDDMVKRWIKDGSSDMPEIKGPKNKGTFVIGTVGDKGLPFTVVKDGKMIGFDIELCERFAASEGKAVKWMDMDFGNLIISCATNKIEMIASTLMMTEERAKKIDFSDAYMRLGVSLFALNKNIAGLNKQAGSSGKSFFTEVAESFNNNIISENRYMLIIDGLKTTVIISILAVLFGTILGGVICFMRMSRRKILNVPARFYISVLRGMPVLVVLMIIFYIVFASIDIDPVFVSVIAFGMNFAAYVAEMYRTGIQSIDKGQIEAGIAGGFTKFSTFRYIVLPQAVKRILPVYKGEVISLVKMTSIVGYIAVQDLTKASDIIRGRTFDAFFPLIMVAVFYFLIAWLLILLLGYWEKKTDPRMRVAKKAEHPAEVLN